MTAEGTHRVERVNGASRLHLGSRPGCAGYEREGHSARRLWAQSSASVAGLTRKTDQAAIYRWELAELANALTEIVQSPRGLRWMFDRL